MHVVQCGNNRQAVFFHDADYVSYLDLLFDSAARFDVSVHAFVCMTNHVHILLTRFRAEIGKALARCIGDGRRGRPKKGL